MDQDQCAERVDDRRRGQGERHPEGDVAVRVFDFLGDACDLGETGIGDKDQTDGRGEAHETRSEEGLVDTVRSQGVAPGGFGDPEDDECGEDYDQRADETSLQQVCFLGTHDVQNSERGGQDDREQGEGHVEVQAQICTHTHQCK